MKENSLIQLYDDKSVSNLDWPKTEEGDYAKRFLEPLIAQGISKYIDNIDVKLNILKIDRTIFPIVINDGNHENAWVCSPYAHYITYAKEQIQLARNPVIIQFLRGLLNVLGMIVRNGRIDSVVYVNNWLFALDLYPKNVSEDQTESIIHFLRERFPQHAIVFRSLNPILNKELEGYLTQQGCDLIASRYVYITDTKNEAIYHNRNIKSDLKQWRDGPNERMINSFADLDSHQILELYNQLYIKSHSRINPLFNSHFIDLMVKQRLLEFIPLQIDGKLRGIAGYFTRDGVMYCPFFGYDKEASDHNKVYRLMNTALLLAAKERGAIFHQSAGASFYKKIRSAAGCVESLAVYTRHLPIKQRTAWSCLKILMNHLGVYYMKQY